MVPSGWMTKCLLLRDIVSSSQRGYPGAGLLLGTASAELYRVPKKDSPRKTLEVSGTAVSNSVKESAAFLGHELDNDSCVSPAVSADIERRVAHYGVNVTAEGAHVAAELQSPIQPQPSERSEQSC